MEELLTLKPDDLRSVRLANDLEKRSSAWPYGWGTRFTVLSANFIYVYATKTVRPSARARARSRARASARERAQESACESARESAHARKDTRERALALSRKHDGAHHRPVHSADRAAAARGALHSALDA